MARLFPAIDPEAIENAGERKVARALVDQLGGEVEVFHSFSWVRPNARGTLQEGECDFVLVDPRRGILYVEVKGGSLTFDGARWLRELPSGELVSLNKDPFAQAQRAMFEIGDAIRAAFGSRKKELPFTQAFAVAFPDSRIRGAVPPSTSRELILDAAALEDAKAAIDRVFASFHRDAHRELDGAALERIREALYPRYDIVPVLWRRIEDQEERLRRLTDQQKHLLDMLAAHRKAAISGVAGSGKTMLAIAKAQAAARAGMRTALLCYNVPLKNWLVQAAVPDSLGDTLIVDNYHGLAATLCRRAGVPFGNPDGGGLTKEFWINEAPELLMQACERLGADEKFDAVVVDEGQDFHELWWASLEGLFRDPADKGCFYVFFDPKQNLYVKEGATLPAELGTPFSLPVNCRNTVRIAEHCAALVGAESRVVDGAPQGEEPEFVHARDLREAFRRAKALHAGRGRAFHRASRRARSRLYPTELAEQLRPDRDHARLRCVARRRWRARRLVAPLQGARGGCRRHPRATALGRPARRCQPLRGPFAREAHPRDRRGRGDLKGRPRLTVCAPACDEGPRGDRAAHPRGNPVAYPKR